MRTLLIAVLSCFVLTTSVDAQDFRTLNLFEAVPMAVKALSDTNYAHWAFSHNITAYENAALRASGFETPSTVIDTTFSGADNRDNTSLIQFGNTPRRRNWSRGSHRSVTTTYSQDRWAGGPVLLVNPYCRD